LKDILILGSSGFIGKSLYKHLNKFYFKTVNSISLIQRAKKKFNLGEKNSNIKTNLIINDIKNIKKLPKCDCIIYCIKSKNIRESLKLFSHFRGLIKNSKKVKIIFLSSGAVYGANKEKKKLTELKKIDINKINQLKGYKKNYAKQKIILENKFYELSRLGFSISVARCFTFYGEQILEDNFFISKLIKLMKLKKKKYLMKNLKHTYRSYMHSYDLCEWLISILKYNNKKFDIYNVGSDYPVNLNHLSQMISKKFNKKITYNFSNSNDEIDYYIPSNRKIVERLKVKTKFDLNKIISSFT
jgi:nucleoside-diphosphate-sugar epimerase